MSKRNLVWLVAIVAVGVVVAFAVGWVWGVLAALATLCVSEVVERSARQKRLAARGADPATPLRDAVKRKSS